MAPTRVQLAIERLNFSRSLVHQYLEDLADEEWFQMPTEGITHIGWQVGHLAFVEYALTMKRIRGDQAGDDALIDPDYSGRFGRGSIPEPDPAQNPAPAELRAALDRVHAQAISELSAYNDAQLDVPIDPHPAFDTKLKAVEFCSQHEMLHAGQIALLRRLIGRSPLR